MNTQEPILPIILFGLFLVIIGIIFLKSMSPKMDNKKKTRGKLINYIQDYDRKQGIVWRGAYEFNVDGKDYTAVNKVKYGNKWMIGRTVKIEYDDSNPKINIISFERRFPVIFVTMGLIIIGKGVNMHLDSRNITNDVSNNSYSEDRDFFKEL